MKKIAPPLRPGRSKKRGQKRHSAFGRHRRIIAGMVYLITKKCTDDFLLLTPSEKLNQILLYCLLLKALRDNIIIHAFCFLNNHFHLVITDFSGKLPAFMRDFLSASSKALQASCGIDRTVWDKKRYNAVQLLDLDAAERKIAYTLLNPTRARLTTPTEWPGLTSAIYSFGELINVKRPEGYFNPRYTPDELSIELSPVAPSFGAYSAEECEASVSKISELVKEETEEILREMKSKRTSFAGAEKVKFQDRNKRSRRRTGGHQPRFATRNKRLYAQAVADHLEFEIEFMQATNYWLKGYSEVEFPPGTYGYKEWFCVRVRAS